MTTATDADIATMPRIADATLAETFHWRVSEEARLYRDCPTAFWLAPDAEELSPPAVVSVAAPHEAKTGEDETDVTGTLGAIGLGSLVAGPVFLATLSLVTEGSGTPLERIGTGIGLGLLSAPFSIPIGAIAAAMPIIIGVCLLSWLGVSRPAARLRRLWAATGGAMGLIIAAAFDAGIVAIPLVLTSIACASAAHRVIDWPQARYT